MGVAGRLVKWAVGIGVAVLAITVAAVMYASERNMKHHGNGRGLARPVDAIIVLGSGTDGDGVLGYSSRRRVATAVELLKAGKAGMLILSGGAIGSEFPPIGALMKEHAIGLGAPPGALLVEPESRTTFENLRFSFELAEAEDLGRLAIATDAFHLERAEWLAGYFGRPAIGLVAVPGLDREPHAIRIWLILREAVAWCYNLGKVIGWETLAAAEVDAEARQEWIR
jgi:uncharacterized SAM-binding protein YcdF (DUF218 family)